MSRILGGVLTTAAVTVVGKVLGLWVMTVYGSTITDYAFPILSNIDAGVATNLLALALGVAAAAVMIMRNRRSMASGGTVSVRPLGPKVTVSELNRMHEACLIRDTRPELETARRDVPHASVSKTIQNMELRSWIAEKVRETVKLPDGRTVAEVSRGPLASDPSPH